MDVSAQTFCVPMLAVQPVNSIEVDPHVVPPAHLMPRAQLAMTQ